MLFGAHATSKAPDKEVCARLQSTLFNALCEGGKAEAANYPFCTIEANSGVVAVPDDRLQVSLLCVLV